MTHTLKTKIPAVLYPAFSKAVIELARSGFKIEMTAGEPTKKSNTRFITVTVDNPVNLYHLGKLFGKFRSEL